MKIDFNAGFSQISRLIFQKDAVGGANETRARLGSPVVADSAFEKQVAEIKDKNKLQESAPEQQTQRVPVPTHTLQPYSVESATTLIPEPTRLLPDFVPEAIATPIVKEEQGTVKTPTVVSVRRLPENKARLQESTYNSSAETYKPLIHEAGVRHGIDPALGMAVAQAESSFNPTAISSDGFASKGLFQLLDGTGKEMMERLSVSGTYDPYNPSMNVDLGVGYLRRLHDIFSQETHLPNNSKTVVAANSSSLEKLAVAAYNAGEGRVASAQERARRAGADPSAYENVESYLPEITQKYVKRVANYREQFSAPFELDSEG